ncbi:MAG TPA: hypothetical protein VGR19_11395 [Allosphingosinicella sp.]|nr:hypothetical protein [Allosphingosinicella sp.]
MNDAPVASIPAEQDGAPANVTVASKVEGSDRKAAVFLNLKIQGLETQARRASLFGHCEELPKSGCYCLLSFHPILGEWAAWEEHGDIFGKESFEATGI